MTTTAAVSTAACRCGKVALETSGAAILHAICYCASCQAAGRQIEALPGAPPVLDADGGTDFVLYRKDRIRCVQGGDLLQARRLKPDSPTRRMVATCCNCAIALDFTKGHWLSVYRDRITGPVPPLAMRVMTSDLRQGVVAPNDVPAYPKHPGAFMLTLVAAWVAMGFKSPTVQGLPD